MITLNVSYEFVSDSNNCFYIKNSIYYMTNDMLYCNECIKYINNPIIPQFKRQNAQTNIPTSSDIEQAK